MVIEFVVHTCLPYDPMYLLLQVSTQTSVAGSNEVGIYGKRNGTVVGRRARNGVGKG